MATENVAVHVNDVPIEPELDDALAKEGVTVVHAPDRRTALEIIRALGMRCLVLMNGRTPVHKRFEFLARLRAENPTCASDTPVVVLDHGDESMHSAPCVVGSTPAKEKEVNVVVRFVSFILRKLHWL